MGAPSAAAGAGLLDTQYSLHAGLPMPGHGAVVGEVASLIHLERHSGAVVDVLQQR